MSQRTPITSELQNTRVRLEPELYERLRKIAEKEDRHITYLIRRAVRVYVEQVEASA